METLNFTDKKGNVIGSITLNPYDFGLIFRSCEYERKIRKIADSLTHFKLTAKGTGSDPASRAAIELAEKQFYEALDEYLQPENSTASLFSTYRPFANVRGTLYGLHVARSIMEYVFRKTKEQLELFCSEHPELHNEGDQKPSSYTETWTNP